MTRYSREGRTGLLRLAWVGTVAVSLLWSCPKPVRAQPHPLALDSELTALGTSVMEPAFGLAPPIMSSSRDPGPNGWWVVGGTTVGGMILLELCCRHSLWSRFFGSDSTRVSGLTLAASGAAIGVLAGLYICLRLHCSWETPRLPRDDFTAALLDTVYFAPGAIGVRLRW